jgi:two-component system chemotaxis response regulator CheB
MKKIRLMVVDDSALQRRLIKSLFADDTRVEVVATASDGVVALSRIEECRPDVITLDVNMPRMDGLTMLRLMRERYSIPVLMLASSRPASAWQALKALELGAFDFIAKPSSSEGFARLKRELRLKVRAAYVSRRSQHFECVTLSGSSSRAAQAAPLTYSALAEARTAGCDASNRVRSSSRVGVVAIGASSGGPRALSYLLSSLPRSFLIPILCVQHMAAGFVEPFVSWLGSSSSLEVKLAVDGDSLDSGCVYLAPAGYHLSVRPGGSFGRVRLISGEPVCGHKPSVDVLFRSVADFYGSSAVCLVLTGMGSDGASGAGEVRRRGGLVICQDRASSAVFGMPRACIERGYCDLVLSLTAMPSYLVRLVGEDKEL